MAEALSLAANIVQFAELANKLVIGTYQIYNSAQGATDDNRFIEVLTMDIQNHIGQIQSTQLGDSMDLDSEDRAAIRNLVGEAESLANDLLGVLGRLKLKKRGKHLESVWKAIQSVLKANEVKALEARIAALMDQISRRFVRTIVREQSTIASKLCDLQETNNELRSLLKEIKESRTEGLREDMDAAPTQTTGEQMEKELGSKVCRVAELAMDQMSYPQRLLRELEYSTMATRDAQIAESYDGTSAWIFEEEKCQGFLNWLKVGKGVFWFRGKVGSGKSTLMKEIQRRQETISALEEWSTGSKLLVASHYFWISGADPRQKSLEGLYRHILYQIFIEEPDLIPIVCPYEQRVENWTALAKLASVFENLLKAVFNRDGTVARTLRYCFFIDGLDEFEESEEEYCAQKIATVVHNVAQQSTFIKVCVSSRPATAFEVYFGQTAENTATSQKIIVENCTRPDMEKFVWEKIKSVPNFDLKIQEDRRWEDIARVVSERAEGVWLWTSLVIGTIVGELERNEGYDQVLSDLNKYPSNLDELYHIILGRLDKKHRKTAMIIFSIFLDAVTPIFAADIRLYLLEPEPGSNFRSLALSKSFRYPQELESLENIRDRLHNRCNNFLEITVQTSEPTTPATSTSTTDSASIFSAKVDFIHRSVRDFLKGKLYRTSKVATHQGAMQGGPRGIMNAIHPDEALGENSQKSLESELASRRLQSMSMVVASISAGPLVHFTPWAPANANHDDLFLEWYRAQFYGFFFHASRLDNELRSQMNAGGHVKCRAASLSVAPDLERLSSRYQYDRVSDIGKNIDAYFKLVDKMGHLVLTLNRYFERAESLQRQWMNDCWLVEPDRSDIAVLNAAKNEATRAEKSSSRRISLFHIFATKARLLLYLLWHSQKQPFQMTKRTLVNLLALTILPSVLPLEPRALHATAIFDFEMVTFFLDRGADLHCFYTSDYNNRLSPWVRFLRSIEDLADRFDPENKNGAQFRGEAQQMLLFLLEAGANRKYLMPVGQKRRGIWLSSLPVKAQEVVEHLEKGGYGGIRHWMHGVRRASGTPSRTVLFRSIVPDDLNYLCDRYRRFFYTIFFNRHWHVWS